MTFLEKIGFLLYPYFATPLHPNKIYHTYQLFMRTLKQQLILGVGSLTLLGWITSCNGTKNEIPVESATSVKTMLVTSTSGNFEREYIGTVESENTVDLSFETNGNIAELYVQEGQSVSKGQLLARLNTTTAKNKYASAKASLNQAKDAYNRLLALYESNSLPEVKYIEAKTSLEQAQANEQISKKGVSDCNLYAPFAGVIGQRQQEAGANVMPGVAVLSLMNISSVKIKIPVPENDISGIKLQDNCRLKISALDNAEFHGKIVEKGVVANPVSHTYEVKVRVDNKQKEMMPGMVCKAYLQNQDKIGGGIIVPIKAVQIASLDRNFVWVVNKSSQAVSREVKTGKLIGNGILIESGLENGDIVITEGYQNLSEGAKVKAI